MTIFNFFYNLAPYFAQRSLRLLWENNFIKKISQVCLGIALCSNVYAAEKSQTVLASTLNSKASTSAESIGSLVQVSIGLAIVLISIFALAWFVKRIVKVESAIGGAFKIIAVLSVGQREKVVLVQVGERQMLLGVAPGSVRTLDILDEPIEGKSSDKEQLSGSFANRLQAAVNQRFSS